METPQSPDSVRVLAPGVAGRPPEIPSNRPGSYPNGVLTRRHPTIVEQVRAGHPYGPRQLANLDALLAEITGGTVQPLPPGSYARREWEDWGAGHFGREWIDAPFLWAEGYFYAKVLTAVDFWGPAPWTGVDPFAPMKTAELASPEYAADLAALDGSGTTDLHDLLLGSLWGNRADLGFLIDAEPGLASAHASRLVADDSAELLQALRKGDLRRVCVLADNSGRELLADLVLLDHLLATGTVGQIELQLKPHPYFVSDATMADLLGVLETLASGPAVAQRLAGRLDTALRTGRLVPAVHWFSGVPYSYDRMPADLRAHLIGFDLVLSKGDLNYRRLVGDCEWPADTAFRDAVGYFPAPLAALRTVKSDVIVGLPVADAEALERNDPGWRVTGRYALVQVRL